MGLGCGQLKEKETLAQKSQHMLHRISPSYLNTFHWDQNAWLLINQYSYLGMAGQLTAPWVPPSPVHHGMLMTSCGPIFMQPTQWKHKENWEGITKNVFKIRSKVGFFPIFMWLFEMEYFRFNRFLIVQIKLLLMYKKCFFCEEMSSVLIPWLPIYPCMLAIRCPFLCMFRTDKKVKIYLPWTDVMKCVFVSD